MQRTGESTDGERVAEYAGRVQTGSEANPAGRTTREFLAVMGLSDTRLLEHATYSLLIEGVSRALVHEWVRAYPAIAWTERAMRFADDDAVTCVMPPAVIGDAALERAWTAQTDAARIAYRAMVGDLMERYAWVNDKVHRRALARDGAAGLLPQSVETRVLATANLRTWRALISAQSTEQVDLEARRLSIALVRVLEREAPSCFADFDVFVASDRHEAIRARRSAE